MQGQMTGCLDQDKKLFDGILNIDKNFDVVYRVITIGDRKACLYAIDGFMKDETLLRCV